MGRRTETRPQIFPVAFCFLKIIFWGIFATCKRHAKQKVTNWNRTGDRYDNVARALTTRLWRHSCSNFYVVKLRAMAVCSASCLMLYTLSWTIHQFYHRAIRMGPDIWLSIFGVIYGTIKKMAMILLSLWHNVDKPASPRPSTQHISVTFIFTGSHEEYLVLCRWVKQWDGFDSSAQLILTSVIGQQRIYLWQRIVLWSTSETTQKTLHRMFYMVSSFRANTFYQKKTLKNDKESTC